jgi:hypothetical protein
VSPEQAIEDAAELLGYLLKPTNKYDGSTIRKLLLGIEHVDIVLYPAKLQAAIDAAPQDPEVDAMLCSFGAAFVEQAQNMPELLRKYVASRLKRIASEKKARTGKRGKHPQANLVRDFAIIYVIARLAERGFSPFRNREQRATESACSVTTQALKKVGVRMITEDAVEKIWRNRTRLPQSLRQYIDQGNEDLLHGLSLTRIVGN